MQEGLGKAVQQYVECFLVFWLVRILSLDLMTLIDLVHDGSFP